MAQDAHLPIPGLGTEIEAVPTEFMRSAHSILLGVTISSAARDSGNTTTTTLRPGLVLGKITASGKYKEYNNYNSDGSEVAKGILYDQVKVLDADANAIDAAAVMVIHGFVDTSALHGCDAAAQTDLAGQIIFD